MNIPVKTSENNPLLRNLAKDRAFFNPYKKLEKIPPCTQRSAWHLGSMEIRTQAPQKTIHSSLVRSQEKIYKIPQISENFSSPTDHLDITKNKKFRKLRPIGPIQFFNTILKTWRLDKSDTIALLGLDPSDQDYAYDLLVGHKAVKGRDVKDRLAYLIQIRMMLSGLFRDEAVENKWLREPHKLLDGKAPMDLLLEGSMENLLLVKEYVEVATGW